LLLKKGWKIHSFLSSGEKQKNVLTAYESTHFHLSFPKGSKHAPAHVMMPTLSSNKKLQGIEHVHFEK
jgi:phosphoglycerol transferase MdoB-like AlkP superfamily enzyme